MVLWLIALVAGCGEEPPRGDPGRLALEPHDAESGEMSAELLSLSLRAASMAWADGWGTPNPKMAVIDYSRPSTARRLWVLDLRTGERLFEERVAQGEADGFSNEPGSHASSLGLFVTGEAYDGSNGASLRLHGLEPGFNDNALARAIVMHGATYSDDEFVERHARLGRSYGCPAVRPSIAEPMIEALEGGALLLVYHPDSTWLRESRFGASGRRE